MAEVNKVPETAVSPEIVDNFTRPAPEPTPPPPPSARPEIRALTPLDELTHIVDYDAFRQAYRLGTRDNPNPVPGAPNSSFNLEDVMMAAIPAGRAGVAMGRTASKLGGRAAAALYRQAVLERAAKAVPSAKYSQPAALERFTQRRVDRLAEELGVKPARFGRLAPGSAPEDLRVLHEANKTVKWFGKRGFKPTMPPDVAKDIVTAQNQYYAAAAPFMQAERGMAMVLPERTAMDAAYAALSKQLKAASQTMAAQKAPIVDIASKAGHALTSDDVRGKLLSAARFIGGVRRYDKYGNLVHGLETPTGWGFDKIVNLFTAPGSPTREMLHKYGGTAAEDLARVGVISSIGAALTKSGRDDKANEAGDDAAATADRNAFGVDPSAAPVQTAPAQTAPARDPERARLKAAFFF